jgi:Cu+-exporting ATPase
MECKGNHSCKDMTGNAGGDSTISGLTCPVSGEPIGEGQGVKFDYMSKTYTFCCEGCVGKFKKEPMSYIKEEVTCPVTGEPAAKDVFAMQDGTKYYFCCKMCISKFEKDPEKYLKKN